MSKITTFILCFMLFPYFALCLAVYAYMFHFFVQLPICLYIGKKKYGYTFPEIINRMRYAEVKFSDGYSGEPIPYDMCLACSHYRECSSAHCHYLSCKERGDKL